MSLGDGQLAQQTEAAYTIKPSQAQTGMPSRHSTLLLAARSGNSTASHAPFPTARCARFHPGLLFVRRALGGAATADAVRTSAVLCSIGMCGHGTYRIARCSAQHPVRCAGASDPSPATPVRCAVVSCRGRWYLSILPPAREGYSVVCAPSALAVLAV